MKNRVIMNNYKFSTFCIGFIIGLLVGIIIASLVICDIAHSQDTLVFATEMRWVYLFSEMDDLTKVVLNKDTVMTMMNPHSMMVILTILQQWDKYEKECYVDSFCTYEKMVISQGDSICFVDIWIHKKPMFEEFIEFLKKKIRKHK